MGTFRHGKNHILLPNKLTLILAIKNTNVRLEAVRALLSLYNKSDYLITLQHFTERFKPRLIKIATSDTDIAVRVAVIQVLGAVDSSGLLEEDQRETLCLLVFDEEPKVRKAVSGFVRGVWEEAVTQRLVGRRGGNKTKDKERAGVKALANMLVGWERALNKDATGLQAEESQASMDNSQQDEATAIKERQSKEIAVLGTTQKSRITHAVEALWEEVGVVQDWEVLLDHVLLDHSAQQAGDVVSASASKRRKKGKPSSTATPRKAAAAADQDDEDTVEEAWRLEEAEETLLVEVLLASLKKSIADSVSNKKVGDLSHLASTQMTNVYSLAPLERPRSCSSSHDPSLDQSSSQTFHQTSNRCFPYR